LSIAMHANAGILERLANRRAESCICEDFGRGLPISTGPAGGQRWPFDIGAGIDAVQSDIITSNHDPGVRDVGQHNEVLRGECSSLMRKRSMVRVRGGKRDRLASNPSEHSIDSHTEVLRRHESCPSSHLCILPLHFCPFPDHPSTVACRPEISTLSCCHS
jgi:hypothetical protein